MFDPYHKWLGIRKSERPPTYFQILGIAEDEEDAEVIEDAALRQTAHVRTYQIGPHSKDCTRLLNEIAQAKVVLSHPEKRNAYRQQLQSSRTSPAMLAQPVAMTEMVADAPWFEPRCGFLRMRPLQYDIRKPPRTGLWIGLGVGAVALIVVLVAAIVVLLNDREKPAVAGNAPANKNKADVAKPDVKPGVAAPPVASPVANPPIVPVQPPPVKPMPMPPVEPPPMVPVKPANNNPNPPIEVEPKANVKPPDVIGDHIEAGTLDGKIAFEPFRQEHYAWSSDMKWLYYKSGTDVCSHHLMEKRAGPRLKGIAQFQRSLALSPDGKVLATIVPETRTQVSLWDIEGGKKIRDVDQEKPVFVSAFSPDGKILVTWGYEYRMWNVATGALIVESEAIGTLPNFVRIADRKIFACSAGRSPGFRVVFDLDTGKKLHSGGPGAGIFYDMLCDGKRVLINHIAKGKSACAVVDNDNMQIIDVERKNSYAPVILSPDGRLAIFGSDKDVLIWDTKAQRVAKILSAGQSPIGAILASSDGSHLLTIDKTHVVRTWSLINLFP